MQRRDRWPVRALAVLSAGLLAGTGLVLSSAGPARAAAAATITVSPGTGPVDASPMFNLATTSAPCPAAFNTSVALKIGPAAGPFKNLAQVGFDGGYDQKPVSMLPTKSLTKALGSAPAAGDYLLIVVCGNAQNAEAPQRFETRVTVTGTTWTADSAAPAAVETTTALAVTPDGHAAKGAPVTMTATVSPATAAGAVTFRSNNGVLGTPVPVVQGVATLTVSSLVAGAQQVTAGFGPADLAAFLPSTSPAVAYQIDTPPPPPSSPPPSSPPPSAGSSASVPPPPPASGEPSDEPTPEPTDDGGGTDPVSTGTPLPSITPVAGSGGGTLPTTGPAVTSVAAGGLALVLAGAAAMFLTRRRARP